MPARRGSRPTRRHRRGSAPSPEPLEPRLLFATFLITTTADAGPGSLRQAILDANAVAGGDLIHFNIPGPGDAAGVHSIRPLSDLPAVTGPVVIDGYTQPGARRNTLAVGSDAVLKIELRGFADAPGSPTPLTRGLSLDAGCTLRGLVLNRFHDQAAVRLGGGCTVEGNFFGTDAAAP